MEAQDSRTTVHNSYQYHRTIKMAIMHIIHIASIRIRIRVHQKLSCDTEIRGVELKRLYIIILCFIIACGG